MVLTLLEIATHVPKTVNLAAKMDALSVQVAMVLTLLEVATSVLQTVKLAVQMDALNAQVVI